MLPAVALKVVVVAPADTVADAGTLSMALLLDSETVTPPAGAAADNVTVQVEVPLLPKVEGVQTTELITTGGVNEILAVLEVLL